MENYKEKYENLIKQLKKEKEEHGGYTFSSVVDKIFPELKESEDEKIRKALIKYLDALDDDEIRYGVSFKDMRTWLEKQGEQKTEIEYIYPKFRIGDVVEPIKPNGYHTPVRVLSIEKKTKSYYCESDDKKSFLSIPIRCEDEYKLVEQKPAWSEEDEEMKRTIISNLFILKKMYTKPEMQTDYNNMIEWLKSLKDRVQPQSKLEWSKEDEKMLNSAIYFVNNYRYDEVCGDGSIFTDCFYTSKVVDWLKSLKPNHWKPSEQNIKDLEWCADLVKDKMGVGFHRLQVFIDEIKKL